MFVSLNITNMYSNIPAKETKQILENILTTHQTNHQIKSEILNWYDIVRKQNYFAHRDKKFIETNSLAMGAPSSSIISEIFLQHFPLTHPPPSPQAPPSELLLLC
jgi:poly(A) polymerase Pap1